MANNFAKKGSYQNATPFYVLFMMYIPLIFMTHVPHIHDVILLQAQPTFVLSYFQMNLSQTYMGGLPLNTYAARGRGVGGQVSYTFPLRITCKTKGGGGSRKYVKLRTYLMEGP